MLNARNFLKEKLKKDLQILADAREIKLDS
jgi:hypothetical protein